MELPKISEKRFLVLLTLGNLGLRFFRINDPSFPYFDEKAFYLPAAREILAKGIDPLFEHPPISKLLFATSVKIFGDNPLGWRFFPIVFSVLSVIVVYFLAKKLFQDRKIASIAAVLFSLDFAWFTSSRLAFPEVIFASLFLLSCYFLTCFLKAQDSKGERLNLVLAVVFFGLALGTKWSALLGLPIFLLVIVYKQRRSIKALLLSFFIFLILVSVVYVSSFALYIQKNNPAELLSVHAKMINYHSQVVNKIVSQDKKLERQEKEYKAIYWPLNNIFSYRFEKVGDTIKSVILFYNPAVLWGALIATVVFAIKFVRKKELNVEKLLLIALFLIFWFPFIFSPRIVYPYYWLAGIPFGTILFAKFLTEKNKKNNQVILGFVITALLLFILYYPLLSNMPVKITYFRILTGTIGFD